MKLVENLNNDSRGVSPVVGVILMVAITVILAAVIGTFVLDLGSNVQQNPQAGVTFDQNGTDVTVQVISMENADGVSVTADSTSPSYDGPSGPPEFNDDGEENDMDSVGQSVTISSTDSDDTVTVIGYLGDKEAVLQTYTIA
jgi:flagellin-like protein